MIVTTTSGHQTEPASPPRLHVLARRWLGSVLKPETERAETQRAAIAAFLVRVTSAALLYASQIFMARWMGTFEYGVYVFAWTWVLILGGLSHGGLHVGMMRLLPQHRARGEDEFARGLLRYGRMFAFIASTAVALIGAALVWLLQAYLANYYVWPLLLALICVPIYALTDVQDGVGRANSWMFAGLVPPYILRPTILLIAMLAFHQGGWPMTAETACLAAIVASWLSGIIQLAMIERRLPSQLRRGAASVDAKGWARMSLPIMLITACEMMLTYTDVIVVSAYLDASQVGIYFAAAKTMALILFVQYAVGSASAKNFATHHASGDHVALAASVRNAVHWTFWPSLVCACIILLLGRPLLWLFGPEFTNAYGVMFILVIGYLARAAMGPSEFLLNMTGQQVAGAWIYVSMAIFNLALNLVLVPLYGLMGAAAATATATTVAAVLSYWVARQRLRLDIGIWANLSRS